MDEIKTSNGRVVGRWNGEKIRDLMQEIARIKQEMQQSGVTETLDSRAMPHRDQLHADLLNFKAYHLWGCDKHGECLVGTGANRIESVEKVLSFSLVEHH